MPITFKNDIAIAIGLIGTITAIALAMSVHPSVLSDVWINRLGMVILAGPSAWLAGLLFGSLFGHQGYLGWLLAFIGACLCTVTGAMIAGTLVFPGIGTLVAPLVLYSEGTRHPLILISWLICMGGLHLILIKSKN